MHMDTQQGSGKDGQSEPRCEDTDGIGRKTKNIRMQLTDQGGQHCNQRNMLFALK